MSEHTSHEHEPAEDVDGLELCEDCAQLVAAGEVSPRGRLEDYPHSARQTIADSPDAYLLDRDEDSHEDNPSTRHADRIAARWPRHSLVVTCSGDDSADCDGFSWSSCDGCGSTLGGTRHSGAALALVRPAPAG